MGLQQLTRVVESTPDKVRVVRNQSESCTHATGYQHHSLSMPQATALSNQVYVSPSDEIAEYEFIEAGG